MKSLVSIVVLFSLSFSLIVKAQILEGISDDKLEHLVFHRAALIDWEKYEKEFKFQSQRFDVVRKLMQGDSIHYWCINDKKEAALLADLSLVMHAKNNAATRNPNQLAHHFLKFMSQLYCSSSVFQLQIFEQSTSPYQLSAFQLPNSDSNGILQPPELV
jgi:hypothetical protein